MNSFLTTHLLRYNGFLVSEDAKSYTADFYFGNDTPLRITLRKPPSSDFAVFQQVFVLEEYQPVVDLIRSNNIYRQPLNILDAGGNTGLTSLFFKNAFPGSRFCIVEPDGSNFKVLQKNTQQNKMGDCKLVRGGVWDKETFLEVNRNFRDGNDWAVNVTESSVDTGLKAFSIPALMKQAGFDMIDILKIDIEGSEKQLFSNIASATEFLSVTKYICIEIHDEFECRDQINDCLIKNKFDFFEKDGLTIGKNTRLAGKLK